MIEYKNNLPIVYSNDYAVLEGADKNIKELLMNNHTRIVNEEVFRNSNLEKIKFSDILETIRDKAFMTTKLSKIEIDQKIILAFRYLLVIKIYHS